MGLIKSVSMMFTSEFQLFVNYFKKNKPLCGVVFFMAILSYWFPLTHFTLSIDEEIALFSDSNITLWSEQGRFGIAFIKFLLQYSQTNSITSTFLAVSAVIVSGIIWSYTLYSSLNHEEEKLDIPGLISAFIFVTFPAFSENIGFSMMSFELGIGWIIISIATLFAAKWAIFNKGKMYMFCSIILTTFATSIYQSFITVYISGVILTLVLFLHSLRKRNESFTTGSFLGIIGKYLSILAISLVFYKLIDKVVGIFITPSAYIDSFIAWGRDEPVKIVRNLLGNFKALIAGELIYGSHIVLMSTVAILLILMVFIYKMIFVQNGRNITSMLLISLVGFISTPFLMALLIGTPLPIRANLILTLFVSSAWYLFYIIIEKKIVRVLVVVCIILMGFYQSMALSQLFYSDYNRYQEDVKLAHQIGYRVLSLNVGELPTQPVVFVGSHTQQERANVIKQEVLGYSFFEWDGGNPARIRRFMQSLGYNYNAPSEEQRKRALQISKQMPIWPDIDSVAIKDGIIIVNLSKPSNDFRLNIHNDGENKIKDSSKVYNVELSNYHINDMEVLANNTNGLILSSNSIDPQISFTLEQKVASYDYVVFEFESNIEGWGQIFLAEENKNFDENISGNFMVKKGLNKVYCEQQEFLSNVASLRLDPPSNSEVHLKRIEFFKK